MKPSSTQWAKVLSRWSDIKESGERRLMIALLSTTIAEEIQKWTPGGTAFRDPYFTSCRFDDHLSLIGLDPSFVKETMLRFAPVEA